MLFRNLLRLAIREGSVRLIDTNGETYSFGDGQGPHSVLRLQRRGMDTALALNPGLAVAEAYMDGTLTIEEGTLRDFIEIAARNYPHVERHWLVKLGTALKRQTRRLKQYNPIGKAQQNVAHHYDLSDALYDLFLDSDRQYSCAYFTSETDSLDEAQEYKKRHLAAKLWLDRPGLRVLDIGSGWGGLGLYLAQTADCEVKGVTLSVEQHKVSQNRAAELGLDSQVEFHLQDYREERQRYDRIVSVGMFEHVGKKNYQEFFGKLYDLLDDDGVCVLHSIGRFNEPGPINPFIRKYIFPGADLPTLSEVTGPVEDSGLLVTDIEILRLHYAETLRHWYERFQANRAKVAELYDERFCRMWEMYLIGCEMGFRHQGLMVFQMQLTKKIDALPLTRDYIHEWERGTVGRQAAAAE